MSDMVIGEFFVPGRARTKGSLKPILVRGPGGRVRASLVEDHGLSEPWKKAMIVAIQKARGAGQAVSGWAEAVEVRAEFVFEREYVVRRGQLTEVLRDASDTPWPTSICWGDLDKLERNLLDALTQGGLIVDDRLVVAMQTGKRWAAEKEQAGVRCKVVAVDD